MTLAQPDILQPARLTTQLRILQTTDLHGHVLAYDYHRDEPSNATGLSRTATLIAKARAAAPLSLLFDSGDFLQGSPLSDRLAQKEIAAPHSHPVIDAMNLLQFDAVTLGNHDLDFGLPYLAEALAQARFSIVSANLTLPAPLQQHIKRFVMLERHDPATGKPIKIGVTGCLPAETLQGAEPAIQVSPVAATLSTAVAEMKAKGADVIVVLAHCGLADEATGECSETIQTISRIGGVHAILGGHTHEVYPTDAAPDSALINGCAVVMSGARGTHLGQIDVTLETNGEAWSISSSTSTVNSVETLNPEQPATPECPDIIRGAAPAHAATRAEMSEQVGVTEGQIDSFFSLVSNDVGLQLTAAAFETHMRSMISETIWADLPILSSATPHKTGARAGSGHYCLIRKGPIAKRDVSDLYGFSDTLCALKITGAELRAWLEQSACVFQQIGPNTQDADLLNPAFPGYRFDVIPQLTYEINITKPPRYGADRKLQNTASHRIENLRYKGALVQDSDVFLAAINSFRAQGHWPEVAPGVPSKPTVVFNSGHRCAGVLEGHIHSRGTITADVLPSWTFSPITGATALFLTAPEAREHMPTGVQFVQITPEGFAQMRLSLG